jgi:hypothetical protein
VSYCPACNGEISAFVDECVHCDAAEKRAAALVAKASGAKEDKDIYDDIEGWLAPSTGPVLSVLANAADMKISEAMSCVWGDTVDIGVRCARLAYVLGELQVSLTSGTLLHEGVYRVTIEGTDPIVVCNIDRTDGHYPWLLQEASRFRVAVEEKVNTYLTYHVPYALQR